MNTSVAEHHRVTFDDGVDEVSGHFVPHGTSMREAGILVYTAHLRDPAGNLLGIYQEPVQED